MLIKICIFILSIAVILNALTLNLIRAHLNAIKRNFMEPVNKSVSENNLNRFDQLLILLNYKEKTKSYHRGNLICAIMDFSKLNNDTQLAAYCQYELDRIKEVNMNKKSDR